MFSKSSTGSWAELQLPCSPSKKWELPEITLLNLFLNLQPQTVVQHPPRATRQNAMHLSSFFPLSPSVSPLLLTVDERRVRYNYNVHLYSLSLSMGLFTLEVELGIMKNPLT